MNRMTTGWQLDVDKEYTAGGNMRAPARRIVAWVLKAWNKLDTERMAVDISKTVVLAALGRPFSLGMLYDCRNDSLIPALTLWDREALEEDKDERPQPNSDFEIVASDSIKDKSSAMDVEASLQASFLCGMVEIEGSGKSTLINGMINYILGIDWKDSFRFKLINEDQSKSQAESQTSKVTTYKINHQDGFKVPYSLTLVDTPGFGDTRGIESDKAITEQIRSLFTSAKGVLEIDAICFVTQASQKYSWYYVKEKQKKTIQQVKDKYEKATEAKITVEELIGHQEEEVLKLQDEIMSLMDTSSRCIARLKEIALRPNPLITPEYIDLLIEGEKSEGKPSVAKDVRMLKDDTHHGSEKIPSIAVP
ncbi:unnamed protein product [Gadus morhua 'NCC']